MFYKNVVYVLPIFFFGSVSEFSGTQIYDTYMYNCYNIFFTGMPICWFAVFDYEYDKSKLLTDMRLYSIGIHNKCFNTYKFWAWYTMSIVQGAFLLFLTFYTLDESSGEGLNIQTFDDKKKVKDGFTISGTLDINGLFIF